MCGIAGTININLCDDKIKIIKKCLLHRGPNEQTHLKYNNVHLVHTRLSIQDIYHGSQPFLYKNYIIIFNGEIYNHLELREKYLYNHSFASLSDTETLIVLYSKYKEKIYDMLDGMFAFCILDKSRNLLILSRDRAGKKPLFIYKKDKRIMFSSELNTIKSVIKNLSINDDMIYSYLRTGFYFQEDTVYTDIKQIKAGSYLTISLDSLDVTDSRYFYLDKIYQKDSYENSLENNLDQVDALLRKSVKSRLLSSDIEVGAFLSGGIDSSLIVAIASEYKENLKTFTVKIEGGYDESALAKQTAQKYRTEHYELEVSLDLGNDIEDILLAYGQPFMDSSAIPSYYVSKEAKKHVSVILNGDGADELFGGYRRYVPVANNWLSFAKLLSVFSSILPVPSNKLSNYNFIYRLLLMSNKKGLDFYLSTTSNIYEDIYTFENNIIFSRIEDYIGSTGLNGLSQMLYLDFNILLFSNLLPKIDISTMSHSLEGRSPFLSRYMLEFAPRLPNNCKIKGKVTKYILRELAKKYLPKNIINQPKRGFEVPIKKWVEVDLKDNIYDLLSHSPYSEKYIDKTFINKVLNKKINISDERRARILWNLFTLEVWYKNL